MPCFRRVFEPFSGIHQAVTAARDKTDPEAIVSMARNGEHTLLPCLSILDALFARSCLLVAE